MNDTITVDAKQVLDLFKELDSRKQKKAYRNALRSAANILTKETKRQLKSRLGKAANSKNWWNGKTLVSGVKSSADKEGTESKVHIMGDFRLKFFEMGTQERFTTGSNSASVRGKDPVRRQKVPASRGKITASYFFRTAKELKEKEVFDSMNRLLSQSIVRVANKYKGK